MVGMTGQGGSEISFFEVLLTILTLLGREGRGGVLCVCEELEAWEGRGI